MNEHVWIQDADDADDQCPAGLERWFAVVDDRVGGVVAYFGDLGHAQAFRYHLMGVQ